MENKVSSTTREQVQEFQQEISEVTGISPYELLVPDKQVTIETRQGFITTYLGTGLSPREEEEFQIPKNILSPVPPLNLTINNTEIEAWISSTMNHFENEKTLMNFFLSIYQSDLDEAAYERFLRLVTQREEYVKELAECETHLRWMIAANNRLAVCIKQRWQVMETLAKKAEQLNDIARNITLGTAEFLKRNCRDREE